MNGKRKRLICQFRQIRRFYSGVRIESRIEPDLHPLPCGHRLRSRCAASYVPAATTSADATEASTRADIAAAAPGPGLCPEMLSRFSRYAPPYRKTAASCSAVRHT
ncbi:hypothetical protein PC41400_07620 [Paenibacillus chitinolyticus]|uniref:Uncharacterized protein n=1 Tax=Paenibacillus chitinolyticus TaxID=79263 RepID=A0A410WTF4_9BACL|nr:hypothetical protein [Paenibacillus chitinolyticus]MCY9588709.1 hypothetical protein [Paenibacillus chitinolyticus]MCY9595787.1 hypothetical protein [Paenibacillus chitinolyticus]QAV17537.1 hypothetical protein PC41400_07620 [Paenibacillus chitinolyticus]